MIRVKTLNKEELIVNADLIETVKATPDTVITLTSKKKILVEEGVEQIIDKVINYHRKISHITDETER